MLQEFDETKNMITTFDELIVGFFLHLFLQSFFLRDKEQHNYINSLNHSKLKSI